MLYPETLFIAPNSIDDSCIGNYSDIEVWNDVTVPSDLHESASYDRIKSEDESINMNDFDYNRLEDVIDE